MSRPEQTSRLRFESFDLDLRTRELRKEGRLIKLQDQPIRLLSLLASRAGELVTRSEIEKALWAEDQFVEFEHGINTAMRKIREALGDNLEKPRYIETLPRKGYRFIAQIEACATTGSENETVPIPASPIQGDRKLEDAVSPAVEKRTRPSDEEFTLPRSLARALFMATQVGYLAMYSAMLYKVEALEDVLAQVLNASGGLPRALILTSAMCGIAIRLYLLFSVGLNHPAAGDKFRRLFPVLFVLDTFWAASPLLLARKMGYGLALGCVAALAYLPFCQRTLMRSIYAREKNH